MWISSVNGRIANTILSFSCTASCKGVQTRNSTELCWNVCLWARPTDRQCHCNGWFVSWRRAVNQKPPPSSLELLQTIFVFWKFQSWLCARSTLHRRLASVSLLQAVKCWLSINSPWSRQQARRPSCCRANGRPAKPAGTSARLLVFLTLTLVHTSGRRDVNSNGLVAVGVAAVTRSRCSKNRFPF